MSKPLDARQYASAKGVLARGPDGNIVLAEGSTVPADSTVGFAPGCLWFKRAGGTFGGLYRNDGTALLSDFNLTAPLDLAGLTSTAAELNVLDADAAVLALGGSNGLLATLAGTGITGGVGTVIKTSVVKVGALYLTQIYIDITGLQAIATDLDIIGDSTNPAYLGQLTTARNGTLEAIRMTCLELPAGASTDIDLYSAVEATGKKDDAIASLFTETALVTSGGAWANGTVKGATAMPAVGDYLYLVNGAGANAGTYTAGKFLIEILGY